MWVSCDIIIGVMMIGPQSRGYMIAHRWFDGKPSESEMHYYRTIDELVVTLRIISWPCQFTQLEGVITIYDRYILNIISSLTDFLVTNRAYIVHNRWIIWGQFNWFRKIKLLRLRIYYLFIIYLLATYSYLSLFCFCG